MSQRKCSHAELGLGIQMFCLLTSSLLATALILGSLGVATSLLLSLLNIWAYSACHFLVAHLEHSDVGHVVLLRSLYLSQTTPRARGWTVKEAA